MYQTTGVLCQEKQEQPLRCFQTSTSCSDGNEEELPYSECCAIASATFMINDTCYECSGNLFIYVPAKFSHVIYYVEALTNALTSLNKQFSIRNFRHCSYLASCSVFVLPLGHLLLKRCGLE